MALKARRAYQNAPKTAYNYLWFWASQTQWWIASVPVHSCIILYIIVYYRAFDNLESDTLF